MRSTATGVNLVVTLECKPLLYVIAYYGRSDVVLWVVLWCLRRMTEIAIPSAKMAAIATIAASQSGSIARRTTSPVATNTDTVTTASSQSLP